MKLLASFTLFGIFAFGALAPNHSALASAQPLKSAKIESSENNDVSGVLTPALNLTPQDFVESSLSLIDPSANRLSLVGLDLSEPLTESEATFLETAIRDAFNRLHKKMGIDLIANSVAVGRDALVAVGNRIAAGNLRGGNRKLERNMYGESGSDIEPCTHQSGPLKGYEIEGCEWDIEIVLECRCLMCSEDEDDTKNDLGLEEARSPREPSQLSPEQRDQLDQPHLHTTPEFWKSEQYNRVPRSNPVDKVAFDQPTYWRPPQFWEPEQHTRSPESNPVDKEGFDRPTYWRPPQFWNPNQRNRPQKWNFEEFQKPNQPVYWRPPQISKPKKRNRSPQSNLVDNEILKLLKESPFRRFHKLNKVRFGRGN
jgi:hypothetical protein